MILPSKQLLNEVLKIYNIYKIEYYDNNFLITYENYAGEDYEILKINTYELQHFIKKWAYKKGYSINTTYRETNITKLYAKREKALKLWDIDYFNSNDDIFNPFDVSTIFSAFEYILKLKGD